MTRARDRRGAFFAVAGVVAFAFACGSRTDLETDFSESADSGNTGKQADSAIDSSPFSDVVIPPPPIDAMPPIDASLCPIDGLTAYMLTDTAALYTLDPPTLTTHLLGTLNCPTSSEPWSITAASSGLIYAVYFDWNVYQIDPTTLSCTATAYTADQLGLSSNTGITVGPGAGGVERFYVYGAVGNSDQLDVSDLTDFQLSNVGTVTPALSDPTTEIDLRADAFGRIFGLGNDGLLVQIDPRTAALVAQEQTSFAAGSGSWALLTWNSDLYFFAGGSVSEYDLATHTLTNVGQVGVSVVGASAAPCIH